MSGDRPVTSPAVGADLAATVVVATGLLAAIWLAGCWLAPRAAIGLDRAAAWWTAWRRHTQPERLARRQGTTR